MRPLAVYVHIPFCVIKCGYCDFNAYAGMDRLKRSYHEAVIREIDSWSDVLAGSAVTSISLGGGTPGESDPRDLVRIAGHVRNLAAALGQRVEVSLEANPGTTDFAALAVLASGGFNRVSFGAQSFDASELRFLDRVHSPQATAASVRNSREAGFASIGLDLIFGIPGQELDSWRRSVEIAVSLGVDHISCYALTVEEGTPLARRVERGDVASPDPDLAADMYEFAEDFLDAAGYRHYEISNWARPGHESRHNLVYWQGGDYLGAGAGAHGFLAGTRYENVAHPREYIARAADGGRRPCVLDEYAPSRPIAMFDWIETHLRLIDGFPAIAFTKAFGRSLDDAAGRPLDECQSLGLIEKNIAAGEVYWRLTRRGRLLHSEVCARILAHLQVAEGEAPLAAGPLRA